MRSRSFGLLVPFVLSLAAGCGASRTTFDSGSHPDGGVDAIATDTPSGADVRDTGRTDTGRVDARPDTGPVDVITAVDVRDVQTVQDTGGMRDTGMMRDVVTPRDTGGGVCNTCVMDTDCVNACGDPGTGSSWCCVDSICTFVSQPTCPAPGQDSGTGGGGDGGIGGDCTFQPCTSDSDCCSAASCCSSTFGACIDPASFGGICF